MNTDSMTEYIDVPTDESLVNVHNFTSSDPNSFYKSFVYSTNNETGDCLLIAKKVDDDEEVDITGSPISS